jgi:hypothetical protein
VVVTKSTRIVRFVKVLGHTALVTTQPLVAAANPRLESLFAARAALKRAIAIRDGAELQVEQLRALVARLEHDGTDRE